MFLEPCVESAGVVFSEPHQMECEDDVFTIVGGLSMFSEFDIVPGEEIIYNDMMCNDDIGYIVLTNVGGLSLFMHHVILSDSALQDLNSAQSIELEKSKDSSVEPCNTKLVSNGKNVKIRNKRPYLNVLR